MDEVIIGRIANYFSRIGVAVIDIETEELNRGDVIRVLGATTDYTQTVSSMEIDHAPVDRVAAGTQVAVAVDQRARTGDLVFRILPYTHVDGLSIGQEGAGP